MTALKVLLVSSHSGSTVAGELYLHHLAVIQLTLWCWMEPHDHREGAHHCHDRENRPPTRQPLRPFMLRSAHSLIRVLSASAFDDGIVVAAKPVNTDPAGGRCRKECPKPSHLFFSSVFEGVGRIGAHKWA
jgi:hypothetical protein